MTRDTEAYIERAMERCSVTVDREGIFHGHSDDMPECNISEDSREGAMAVLRFSVEDWVRFGQQSGHVFLPLSGVVPESLYN